MPHLVVGACPPGAVVEARMFANTPNELPQVIGFVLRSRFSMIAFTAAVEVMRQANRLSDRHLYEWPIYSVDGEAVTASNGLALHPEGSLDDAGRLQTFALCGGLDIQRVH